MPRRNSLPNGYRCGSARTLSGLRRYCILEKGHGDVHHALTVTGAPRYWIADIQGEFATLTDVDRAMEDKLAKRRPVPYEGPELFDLDPAEFKPKTQSRR